MHTVGHMALWWAAHFSLVNYCKKSSRLGAYSVFHIIADPIYQMFNKMPSLGVEYMSVSIAKWIWDNSIFSSIRPKFDKRLFIYFCVFPRIYLSCTKNFFILMSRTIFGATQVNSGENTKVNKQSLVMFWLNWIESGAAQLNSIL